MTYKTTYKILTLPPDAKTFPWSGVYWRSEGHAIAHLNNICKGPTAQAQNANWLKAGGLFREGAAVTALALGYYYVVELSEPSENEWGEISP